jgi:type VI secretion system protein ImpL
LLLVVSARTLNNPVTDAAIASAENVYRQLCVVQERFEFALPVYIVVTESDAIDGFAAFWHAQPLARQAEMFGWSAPTQSDNGNPEDWADRAFDSIGQRLKTLQLEVAAHHDYIDDADPFFLFPRHLQALQLPLRQWLRTVFQQSAWHAGFFCRGIYFTGSLAPNAAHTGHPRKDIKFVDDLITE